jgi:hypothetical protein
MIEIKRDLDEIYHRNNAFLNKDEIDRPLIGIHIWGPEYKRLYKETNKTITDKGEINPDDIITENFLKDVNRIIAMNEEIGGDVFWSVAPYFYIPWMEAIIGCPVYSTETTFYAEAYIDDWDNFFNKEIDLSKNNKWLSKLLELQSALVEYLGLNYPVSSSTLLRGPVDMIAASLGQTRMPLELYDNPDKIEKACSLYSNVFIEVAKLQNEIASKSKFNSNTLGAYGIWTKNVCQYLQDDAMASVSPNFYKQLILKNHAKIINNFYSIFYHVHPISLFVIDELLKMERVSIIELNREPEATGPTIVELLPTFRKIQENNKCLLINFTQSAVSLDVFKEEVELICKNLSYKGLCIYAMVDDINDGVKKMKIINEILGKNK